MWTTKSTLPTFPQPLLRLRWCPSSSPIGDISTLEKKGHFYFGLTIRPYLSTARRGFECQIPLYKVFNYVLYRLHTGCQWASLPIERAPDDPEKKKSVMTLFTTISASGAVMGALKSCGKGASCAFETV